MIPVVYAQGLGQGTPAPLTAIEDIFGSILGAAIPFAGIVLFIVLVIGGFQFITSGGDPKKAAAARNTLTYAIIGIVLLALAYLVIVIIAEFTGAEGIKTFDIYR
jgi:hypothetical protein